jgi:hypothetical protein
MLFIGATAISGFSDSSHLTRVTILSQHPHYISKSHQTRVLSHQISSNSKTFIILICFIHVVLIGSLEIVLEVV